MLVVAVAFLRAVPAAQAHPGDDHPRGLRVWKDAEGLLEIEVAFVVARDGEVKLWKDDGSFVWITFDRLSRDDRGWVRQRLGGIANLVQPRAGRMESSSPMEPDDLRDAVEQGGRRAAAHRASRDASQ